jgi:hypothetical protein
VAPRATAGCSDQVSATHNERRRGQRPDETIKYLRLTTSSTAGCGLGTTIKYLCGVAGIGLGATFKYLRDAADISLGTTTKNLQRTKSAAAGSDLGATAKYLVNQNAGAANNWTKAHNTKAGHELCWISLLCSGFCTELKAPRRGTSLGSCVCGARARLLCSFSERIKLLFVGG